MNDAIFNKSVTKLFTILNFFFFFFNKILTEQATLTIFSFHNDEGI